MSDPDDIERIKEVAYEDGRRAGIKEVVGWVNKHLHKSPSCSYDYCFGGRVWRAKRREWRIGATLDKKRGT